MAKGIPTILKEENGVVLAQWGEEYVTWIRDCNGGFAWGHYFTWYNCTQDEAHESAIEDYEKRVKQYATN